MFITYVGQLNNGLLIRAFHTLALIARRLKKNCDTNEVFRLKQPYHSNLLGVFQQNILKKVKEEAKYL